MTYKQLHIKAKSIEEAYFKAKQKLNETSEKSLVIKDHKTLLEPSRTKDGYFLILLGRGN